MLATVALFTGLLLLALARLGLPLVADLFIFSKCGFHIRR